MNNRTDVIRLLLQKVVDVNKRDRFGETYFYEHATSICNSPDAIAMMLELGTSINITDNERNKLIDYTRPSNSKGAVCMLQQL